MEPFFSFMLFFQHYNVHNMLAMMLDPHYKGLGVVMQFVGKENILHVLHVNMTHTWIVKMNGYCLCSWFVYISFWTPNDVGEKIHIFTLQSIQHERLSAPIFNMGEVFNNIFYSVIFWSWQQCGIIGCSCLR